VGSSKTATLDAPWPEATVTDTFIVYTRPPKPPTAGPHWLSPMPDGRSRWVWGDSYFGTACVIDGPNKQGLVCVLHGAAGNAWYHKPGNAVGSDSGVGEIHVFDFADLGAAAKGEKNPWNVQPCDMKDITDDLKHEGYVVTGSGREQGGPAGAAFDS